MPISDSDQPVQLRSLIRVFDGRSMSRQGSNTTSDGKLRLRSDCAVAQTDLNTCCTHMLTCTLSRNQLNLSCLDDIVTCNLSLHRLTIVHSIRVRPSMTSVERILRDACGITEQNKKQVVSLNPANT